MSRTVAVLAALVAVSRTASAYVALYDQWGDLRVWKQKTIGWYVASAGSQDVPKSELEAALQAAFDSWEAVSCTKVQFSFGGQSDSAVAPGVFIRFKDNSWDASTGDALAVTTNWVMDGQGGGTQRAEIHFNGVNCTWTTSGADSPGSDKCDVQGVAAHEIGHAIGLDHPRERFATMFFSSYPGQSEAARSLEEDDKRGACFLYPTVPFKVGAACDACATGTNCQSGVCLDFGEEGAFCGQECGAALGCPDGFTCYNLEGVAKPQCIPDNEHCAPVGGNIQTGGYCYDHATCASSLCLPTAESAFCTVSCTPGGAGNGGCPSAMMCLGAAGKDGTCYPQGNAALGDFCDSLGDCASGDCVGIGDGKAICTQPCAQEGDCPSGFTCSAELCLKKGTKAFGEPCELITECESTLCAGYCTQACSASNPCPGESKCLETGYCQLGPTGTEGEACGEGAEQCISSLFCYFTASGQKTGTCRQKCDARSDSGCTGGKLCQWVWQAWLQKVVGLCVPDNGGAGEGEACQSRSDCRADLVCADTDGGGAKCLRDCNGNNLLGCPGGSTCIPLGLEDDPKLGACHPDDGAPPVEDPTVPEPPPPDAPDAGPAPIDDAGEVPAPTEDASGEAPKKKRSSGGTGGCEASGRGGSGALAFALVSWAGLLLRRRRVRHG